MDHFPSGEWITFRAARPARSNATPVFDLLMEYPPDWPLRSAAVAARDRVCTNCGSGKILQAHHVVPLSKGGTNRLDNLTLLCRRCHRRTHGGKEFSGDRSVIPLAIADRVQLLQEAIASGRDVEFLYRKPTDVLHEKRLVTPRALVEIGHEHDDGRTLCLTGYCYLRQADRTFALKRMKAVKEAGRPASRPVPSPVSGAVTRRVIPCPGCNQRLGAPAVGHPTIRCPQCGRVFRL